MLYRTRMCDVTTSSDRHRERIDAAVHPYSRHGHGSLLESHGIPTRDRVDDGSQRPAVHTVFFQAELIRRDVQTFHCWSNQQK